jgi:hypothetical protein
MCAEEYVVPDSFYVYEIEDIVAEINRRSGTSVELHPSWKYPIWASAGGFLEFKLRDRTANAQRIFDLTVREDQFVASSSRSKRLTTEAAARVTLEIESFFRRAGTAQSIEPAVQAPRLYSK